MQGMEKQLEAPDDTGLEGHGHKAPGFWILSLGSIGVVYGDIGTSPLYALREAVLAAMRKDGAINEAMIYGVVSLILWALVLIVTLKYVLILLNADNKGEGGTLSLMALAQRAMGSNLVLIPALGMIGAALFYGDAIITPAISVLSAVEGLKIVTPALDAYVLPITIGIIIALFLVQMRGTASIAKFFGPITLVWFAVMAWAGLIHIVDRPGILHAFNPAYAISFLATHGVIGLVTLGAVFLAVTGAEALYADLGHFGKRPIQFAWIAVVLPSLTLNYLGQGAILLADPAKIENPFFLMVPAWALLPTVILAAAATIIASQAVITGAYSLSRQAIQLGLLPRMEIRFTSEAHAGQVYMPQINWLLLFGVLILVLFFRTSSSLASAYGIAVTGTMVVTAIMAIFVMWKHWRWPLWSALLVMLPLLGLDVVFLGANSLKIREGGWVPLALGAGLVAVMWTWRTGARIIFEKTRKVEVPLADLVTSLGKRRPHCVPGTAVFFTSDPASAPTALMHSLKHFRVLHENNVILTIRTSDLPVVPRTERVEINKLDEHFSTMVMTFGYMETPNVPKALGQARKTGVKFDIMSTSFFLSRRSVRASAKGGMPLWQDKLFIALARNADDASHYFRLPTDRVIEVGTQVTV
jgi:KUP system potassium uptake protein